MAVQIALVQGLTALVDDEDADLVRDLRWSATSPRHSTRYAQHTTWQKGAVVYRVMMHRLIMNPGEGFVVDHIDGNGLNNRRSNLRVCTVYQNSQNRRNVRSSGAFRGVQRVSHGKFAAFGFEHSKRIKIGIFDNAEDAAKARDKFVYEKHGEFARLNFPREATP